MSSTGSITLWIERLRCQDDSTATNVLWQQFATRVLTLARFKLRHRRTKVADEDDVANSVFEALFTGVANGSFPNLNNRDDLWALLIRLTEHKAMDLLRYESRKKRGPEAPFIGLSGALEARETEDRLDELVDKRPTPDEEIQLAEACSSLLSRLEDPLLVAIAQFKLEGHSNEAIAELVAKSLRTVERKVALIRSIWSEAYET